MSEEKSVIEIRYTEQSDGKYLKEWLMDPSVNFCFPMCDEMEVDDAVHRWISFYRYKCSLTALYNGEPCGLATLYLNPYKKIAHQCEFGIIIGGKYRNKGIGSDLLKNLENLAKKYFNIELLHLQVYGGNPAIRLYERLGFKEFGKQNHWIKEKDGSFTARIFMEKELS